MVWALILVLLLSSPAYAETVDVVDGEGNYVETQEVEEQPVHFTVNPEVNVEMPQQLTDSLTDLSVGVGELNGRVETLSETVGQLVPAEPEPLATTVAAVAAPSTVYAALLPSSTGAQYLSGLLPKMAFGDDYVAWQDSQASYTVCWGKGLRLDGTRFTGSGLTFARFYRDGSFANYFESGNTDLLLNVGSYAVCSSLGDYPALGDGTHEVYTLLAFLAVCGVSCVSLERVWSFLLRMRGAGSDA